METAIRIGVSAAIVRDGQILLIEFDTTGSDPSGVHYNFPGGGVKTGESLHEALVREVKEEACADIVVGPLLHIFEYVPARCHAKYGSTPKINLLFRCELAAGCVPHMPDLPDSHQIGVSWVSLDGLTGSPAPKALLPTPSQYLVDLLRMPSQETVCCELIGCM